MLNQVTPHLWLSLTPKARQTLAHELSISKSSHPEVIQDATGSHLVSDGHTAQDLLVGITLEKMQAYLHSSSDEFYALFEECARKADPACFPVVEEVHVDVVQAAPEPAPVVEAPTVAEPAPVTEPAPVAVEVKPFCDFCDSKGGLHKLNCTKPKA